MKKQLKKLSDAVNIVLEVMDDMNERDLHIWLNNSSNGFVSLELFVSEDFKKEDIYKTDIENKFTELSRIVHLIMMTKTITPEQKIKIKETNKIMARNSVLHGRFNTIINCLPNDTIKGIFK